MSGKTISPFTCSVRWNKIWIQFVFRKSDATETTKGNKVSNFAFPPSHKSPLSLLWSNLEIFLSSSVMSVFSCSLIKRQISSYRSSFKNKLTVFSPSLHTSLSLPLLFFLSFSLMCHDSVLVYSSCVLFVSFPFYGFQFFSFFSSSTTSSHLTSVD